MDRVKVGATRESRVNDFRFELVDWRNWVQKTWWGLIEGVLP